MRAPIQNANATPTTPVIALSTHSAYSRTLQQHLLQKHSTKHHNPLSFLSHPTTMTGVRAATRNAEENVPRAKDAMVAAAGEENRGRR